MITLSIITINYNNKFGLEKTINSIINQTCRNFEFIIIDGGSDDGSIDIIKKYNELITIWVSEKDNGIYNAMNKGISYAKGKYCNFLNSGDTYHDSNVLSIVLKKLMEKDIYIGNCYNFFPTGKFHSSWNSPEKIFLKDLYKATPNHQATFIKTTLMANIRYNEKYKILGDFDFFINCLIIKNCTYEKIDLFIVDYEVGGMSSSNMKLYYQEKYEILNKYIPPRILEEYELINENSPLFYKLIDFIVSRRKLLSYLEGCLKFLRTTTKLKSISKSLWK